MSDIPRTLLYFQKAYTQLAEIIAWYTNTEWSGIIIFDDVHKEEELKSEIFAPSYESIIFIFLEIICSLLTRHMISFN